MGRPRSLHNTTPRRTRVHSGTHADARTPADAHTHTYAYLRLSALGKQMTVVVVGDNEMFCEWLSKVIHVLALYLSAKEGRCLTRALCW